MDKSIRDKEVNKCGMGCKPIEVPTEEELSALNALRKVKNRVRELKKRFSEITSSAEKEGNREASVLEEEMKALKLEWKKLEEERENATRKRMILLGHEKGPL